MCEFMSVMAERSVKAFESDATEEVKESLLLQRAFLTAHVLSWYDEFSKLAEQLVEERFYRGALEFSGAFSSLIKM